MIWQRLSHGLSMGLFALFVVAVVPILFIAVDRDAGLARLPADQVANLGPKAGWRLDHGAFLDAETLLASEAGRPFTPADGQVPVAGFLYFEEGYLWLKLALPDLGGTDRDLVLTLDDPRARTARLVVVRDGKAETLDWSFDQIDRRSGLGLTDIAFVLDRDQLRGATAYLAFKTYGSSRGKARLMTRAAFEQAQLRKGVLTGLINGAALVLGVYLAVIGLRMRETSMLYAAAMAFTLGWRNLGAAGIIHSPLMQGQPHLADILVYGFHALPTTFWLLFLTAFLDLRRTSPGWYGFLLVTAGLAPLQSVLNILRSGFGWDVPISMSVAVPTLFGTVVGIAFLVIRGARRDWLALYFLLAWLPIGLAFILRALNGLFVSINIPLGPFEQPGLDMVVSLTALAILLTLTFQARETRLRVAAAQSEQRFRDYAEIGQDGVIELDGAGMVSHAVGPLAGELGLLPGVRAAAILPALDQPAQGRREIAPEAGRWLALDERGFTDPSSRLSGRRVILSDITADVAARDHEAQRNTLAALGQLAGGIAHEVNNLLHPMINLTRRVQRLHGVDAEGQKLLDMVAKSGVRAGEIVSGVLKAYAPGRLRSTLMPLDQAVAEAVETLRIGLPASCDWTADIAGLEAPPMVSGGEVLQVLSNLVSNALKATGGAGRLEVTLRDGPAGPELALRDNGRGMTEEFRTRATTLFVTEGAQAGVGIGLAVVADLVATWSAELRIDSALGQGTTVTITFPRPASHGRAGQPGAI